MSTYKKIYNRVNWENDPSTMTPINEDNLNNMDSAIDVLDDRVVELSQYTPSIQEVEELPEQGVESIFYEVNGSLYVWNDASSSYTQLANQSAITDMQYLVYINDTSNSPTISTTFASIADKLQTPTGSYILAKLYYKDSNNHYNTVWGSLSSSNLYPPGEQYIKFIFNVSEGDRNIIKEYSINVSNELSVTTYSQVNQAKLTAGANITIDDTDPSNPVISSTGGGGGGSYVGGKGINISGSTISADANTYNPTYSCAVDLDDISVSGYNVTLTTNARYADIYQKCFNTTGQNYNNMKFSPTISFRTESGTEYHKSWNIIKKIQFYYSGSTWKVKFVVNISKDKWLTVIHDDHNDITATVSNEYYLTSSNAGDGISITNGVISVSYPNGDNIEY